MGSRLGSPRATRPSAAAAPAGSGSCSSHRLGRNQRAPRRTPTPTRSRPGSSGHPSTTSITPPPPPSPRDQLGPGRLTDPGQHASARQFVPAIIGDSDEMISPHGYRRPRRHDGHLSLPHQRRSPTPTRCPISTTRRRPPLREQPAHRTGPHPCRSSTPHPAPGRLRCTMTTAHRCPPAAGSPPHAPADQTVCRCGVDHHQHAGAPREFATRCTRAQPGTHLRLSRYPGRDAKRGPSP